jgi:hypothetical protein
MRVCILAVLSSLILSMTAWADDNDPASDLQEILSLAGWDSARLGTLRDGEPLSAEDTEAVLRLLMRMESFDDESIARWTRRDVRRENLKSMPQDRRGQMVQFEGGRVRQIHRHELSPSDAERLGFPAYFEFNVENSTGKPLVTVLTPRVPRAWTDFDTLNEPVLVTGLFMKLAPTEDEPNVPLLLAKRIAWHPERGREPYVGLGEIMLAGLGVDIGLLEDIENRQPIRPQEREAFYQILAGMKQTGPNQLVRMAESQLPAWQSRWQQEKDRITNGEQSRDRLPLVNAVLERAAEGKYSIAPLFNDADAQIGELLVVDGVCRRAVRVEVGTTSDGQPSDVERRFGISAYYELEVFTEDSQNLPLVFCVLKLPPTFPTGDNIREPVRIAGFFFKTWRFQSRKPNEGASTASQSQLAPLLIGAAPLQLKEPESTGHFTDLVAGTVFVLTIGGIWFVLWRFSRSDREFQRKTLSRFRE